MSGRQNIKSSAYIFSSNQDALIIESVTPTTNIKFIAQAPDGITAYTPKYIASYSNSIAIFDTSNILADFSFDSVNNIPISRINGILSTDLLITSNLQLVNTVISQVPIQIINSNQIDANFLKFTDPFQSWQLNGGKGIYNDVQFAFIPSNENYSTLSLKSPQGSNIVTINQGTLTSNIQSYTPIGLYKTPNSNYALDTDATVNFGGTIYVNGRNSIISKVPAPRTIVLQDYNILSDHQYVGFGVTNSTFVYQIPSSFGWSHSFRTATSGNTSSELLRILADNTDDIIQDGTPTVLIGTPTSLNSTKNTLLHLQTPANHNYTPLIIRQLSSNADNLQIFGSTGSNFVITNDSHISINNTIGLPVPSYINIKNTTNSDFVQLINSNSIVFSIGPNGNVGIGTNYSGNTLIVKGIIQADGFTSTTSNTDSSFGSISVDTITTRNSTSNINFDNKNITNVNDLRFYGKLYNSNILLVDNYGINPNAIHYFTDPIIYVDPYSCNIGIGTLATLDKLTVHGDTTFTRSIKVSTITPSNLNTIDFSFAKILNVDQLIVRSNIQVLMTNYFNYSNLPADIIRLDPATGKVPLNLLNNIYPILDETGKIPITYIPNLSGTAGGTIFSTDRIGVGTRSPLTPFNMVGGPFALQYGTMGIGTTVPLGALHIYDTNLSPYVSLRIDQVGSTNHDMMYINGNGGNPVLYVVANNRVGICTALPQSTLDVNGSIQATTVSTPILRSSTGSIDLGGFIDIANVRNLSTYYLDAKNVSTASRIVQLDSTTNMIPYQYIPVGQIIASAGGFQYIGPNAGVGTTQPQQPLHVEGNTFINGRLGIRVQNPAYDLHVDGNTYITSNVSIGKSLLVDTIVNYTGSSNQITMNSPLWVHNYNPDLYTIPAAVMGNYMTSASSNYVSIRADYNIQCQSFLAVSDKRIKKEILPLDSTKNQSILDSIQVCEYTMRESGERTVGFIAQEVVKHAPYAVNLTEGFLPSIMKTAIFIKNNTYKIQEHSLSINDLVKVILATGEVNVRIIDVIDEDTITIDIELLGTAFFYGKFVNDFHILNHDRLMAHVFKGVQDMYKTQCTMEDTLQNLIERLSKLEQRVG